MKQQHLSQRERFQDQKDQFSLFQTESMSPPPPPLTRSTEALSLDDLLRTQRISPIGVRAISESSFGGQEEDDHNHATSTSLSLTEILQEIENISSPTRPLSSTNDSFEISPSRRSSSPRSSSPSSPFLRSQWGGPEPRILVSSHQTSFKDLNFGELRTRLFSIDASQESFTLPHASSGSASSDSLTFLKESLNHQQTDSVFSSYSRLSEGGEIFSEGSRLSTHTLETSLGNDASIGALYRPSDHSIGMASSQSTNSSILFLGVGEPSLLPDLQKNDFSPTSSLLHPSLPLLSPPSSSAQSLEQSKDLLGEYARRSDSDEGISFETISSHRPRQSPNLSFQEKYGLQNLPVDDSSDDEAHMGMKILMENSSSQSTSSSLSIPSFKLTKHNPIDGAVVALPEISSSSYFPSKSVWSPRQREKPENSLTSHPSKSNHHQNILSHSMLSFNSSLSSNLSPSHSNTASPSQSGNFQSGLQPTPLSLLPPSLTINQTITTQVTHQRVETHRQQTSHHSSFRDSTEEFESWLEGHLPSAAIDPAPASSHVELNFSSGSESSEKAKAMVASSSMRLSFFSSSSESTESHAQRSTELTQRMGTNSHLSFLSSSSESVFRSNMENSSGSNRILFNDSSSQEGLPTEYLLGEVANQSR